MDTVRYCTPEWLESCFQTYSSDSALRAGDCKADRLDRLPGDSRPLLGD